MKTLIVGIGALGGVLAARLEAAGFPAHLATRDRASAATLKEVGLHVTGIGGAVSVPASYVGALDDYGAGASFDLIVLATKARDAIEIAPRLFPLLAEDGLLLPIQNGGVSQLLAERFGDDRLLGGLSNLGATMTTMGRYEQRNAGHLLLGEITGGDTERAERVRRSLARAVDTKTTSHLRGAIWSKLLLNCSVTTLGAIAGCTMREYIASPECRELFDRTYDETLSVAFASGAHPSRMLVEPVPPGWADSGASADSRDTWLGRIIDAYGDLKPSMLQDFERGRATEIDFINGYVASMGMACGIPTPMNAAIVKMVHAISRGELAPNPSLLRRLHHECV